MQGEQAAAHVVRPRDARAGERPAHPAVELDALGPPAVRGIGLRGVRQRRALAVVEVAALGEDRQPLARLLAQGVQGLLHEIRTEHDLVVVQEDHAVVGEDARGGEAHVADGPVSAQGHRLARGARGDPVHAVADADGLALGEDRDGEGGMGAGDSADPLARGVRARRGAHHEHDDAADVARLLERGQAGVELGLGRVQVGAVVVGARRLGVHGVRSPIGGDHDRRIHTRPFPPRALAHGAGSRAIPDRLSWLYPPRRAHAARSAYGPANGTGGTPART